LSVRIGISPPLIKKKKEYFRMKKIWTAGNFGHLKENEGNMSLGHFGRVPIKPDSVSKN